MLPGMTENDPRAVGDDELEQELDAIAGGRGGDLGDASKKLAEWLASGMSREEAMKRYRDAIAGGS